MMALPGKDVVSHDVEVEYPSKRPIQCIRTCTKDGETDGKPSIVFTHGAGGTLKADAVVNFSHGFAQRQPILCFQGSMNLKARAKMFDLVCKDQQYFGCLGGRSMGARAAVMAATSETTHIVLVSYPLHTPKETRDQILLALPKSVKVLFISGDKDNMCDLDRLEPVRRKMQCNSWLCVVKGADHGMNMKVKAATREMGMKTGEVAALWLEETRHLKPTTVLSWDAETAKPVLEMSGEESPRPTKKRKRSTDEPSQTKQTVRRRTSVRKGRK